MAQDKHACYSANKTMRPSETILQTVERYDDYFSMCSISSILDSSGEMGDASVPASMRMVAISRLASGPSKMAAISSRGRTPLGPLVSMMVNHSQTNSKASQTV